VKKLSLNCGSCLYLNRDKIYEKRCTELGKLPTSKCCASHKPDVFSLIGDEEKVSKLSLVSKAIVGLGNSELQALAALLANERNTRKYGWRFYQKVYIRYTGDSTSNYLSNFAVGYVVSADKDTVRVVGESGVLMVSAINEKDSATVYTLERFQELSRSMVKAGKKIDPKSLIQKPFVQKLDAVLDSNTPISKKLVKSKTRTDDLVAIIAKMSKGLDIRSKKKSRDATTEIVMDWRS
jgi:hypothetical protein